MASKVGSLFAEYWAKHPHATAREAGDYGIAHMKRLVSDGKFQEGADFIHAWMGEFSKASAARADLSTAALGTGARSSARAASTTAAALPSGISGGKIAATIAGVGLAVAAAYYLFGEKPQKNHQPVQSTSWSTYVDQRRLAALPQDFSPPR